MFEYIVYNISKLQMYILYIFVKNTKAKGNKLNLICNLFAEDNLIMMDFLIFQTLFFTEKTKSVKWNFEKVAYSTNNDFQLKINLINKQLCF